MNRVIAHPDVQRYYPLLAESAHSVASYQLRTRATIIGNICNASPAGDTIGACLVYQGRAECVSAQMERARNRWQLSSKVLAVTPSNPATSSPPSTCPSPPLNHAGIISKSTATWLVTWPLWALLRWDTPIPTVPSGYRFRLALASVAPVPFVPSRPRPILAEKPHQCRNDRRSRPGRDGCLHPD